MLLINNPNISKTDSCLKDSLFNNCPVSAMMNRTIIQNGPSPMKISAFIGKDFLKGF
jgi:hypothetical protein